MASRVNVRKVWRVGIARIAGSSDRRVQFFYRHVRDAARAVVRTVTPFRLGWIAKLQRLRWLDDTTLEISGYAFERGYATADGFPEIVLRLRAPGLPPVTVPVTHRDDFEANDRVRSPLFDYANTAFTACLDVRELVRPGDERTRRWQLEIITTSDKRRTRGPFQSRQVQSSAYYPSPRWVGDREVCPVWDLRDGLALRVGRPRVTVTDVAVDGRALRVGVRLDGITLARAELRSRQGVAALATRERDGVVELSGPVPASAGVPRISEDDLDAEFRDEDIFANWDGGERVVSHRLVVTDSRGGVHEAHVPEALLPSRAALPYVYASTEGALRVLDADALLVVSDSRLTADPPALTVTGTLAGDVAGLRISLVGPRAYRAMSTTIGPDGRTFTGEGPLLASLWGGRALPPVSGLYNVEAHTDAGPIPVVAGPAVIREAPDAADYADYCVIRGVRLEQRVCVRFTPPRRPDEIGDYHQRELRRRSQSARVRQQFYFESFYGRQATCNPLALDRDVAERFPDLPRYWGVVDASVQVPDGAIPVIAGSRAWWDARHSSRFVVANEWLGGQYRHRPGQFVLQTWHGSMLKRIGLDRDGQDIITNRALRAESAQWDFLLSQNPHSTEIFKSAYAWEKEIWDEGYPRNDAIFTQPGQPIRRLLGIDDDRTVLLYAPTWREDRTEMVTFLDVERLMDDLGPGYVLLLRGHSRTMNYGADVRAVPGVIDVTTYPNVTDLFVVADALITDYSSVMFDYSNTGRPMIFFVPDMDDYRDTRGVYFDLSELAPGPVLATQDEVTAAVDAMNRDEPAYRERYDAWRAKFNPWDDATCAGRIVDRLLAFGD